MEKSFKNGFKQPVEKAPALKGKLFSSKSDCNLCCADWCRIQLKALKMTGSRNCPITLLQINQCKIQCSVKAPITFVEIVIIVIKHKIGWIFKFRILKTVVCLHIHKHKDVDIDYIACNPPVFTIVLPHFFCCWLPKLQRQVKYTTNYCIFRCISSEKVGNGISETIYFQKLLDSPGLRRTQYPPFQCTFKISCYAPDGPIYTRDGSSVHTDHPSSVNTGKSIRRTIGARVIRPVFIYQTSLLDRFPRKHD